MKPKPRAFVLGSGIAGLATGEILSRNGYQVTLVEREHGLGGDASRSTQNWFHTGWLYAALANDAATRDCQRALRLFHPVYGKVVRRESLNLEVGALGVGYPASRTGWFSADRVLYLYALATHELSWLASLLWCRRLKGLVVPRLRALGYEVNEAEPLPANLRELLDRWEGGPGGHAKYAVMRSTDAQINTRRVLDTLVSLLGHDAEVVCGAESSLVARGDRSIVRINGENHAPDLVVIATGKNTPLQLTELGRSALASRFKSISSPIVVLDRALELPNFIRFTPSLPHTVNHMKYQTLANGTRSTIGSYEYYPASEVPDISPFANRVCKRLGVSTSEVAGVYYGTKTEYTGSAERRYNHAVGRVNENTTFAIPGKFSQFPLLVHEFANLLGLRTDLADPDRGCFEGHVMPTLPEQCLRLASAESAAGHRASRDDARVERHAAASAGERKV